MSDDIRNCEFRFKCPKTWEALEQTPVESQRYCGECQKIVHYCETAKELEWAIVRNLCVAVRIKGNPPKNQPLDSKLDGLSIGYVADYFSK